MFGLGTRTEHVIVEDQCPRDASWARTAPSVLNAPNWRHRGASVRDVWEEQVSAHPTTLFVIHVDPDSGRSRALSYAEFDDFVNRIANAFLGLGTTAGDRVVVHQRNTLEFVGCLLAVAKIGAVLLPLGAMAADRECAEIISRCSPRVMVTDAELLVGLHTETVGPVGCVLVTGGMPASVSKEPGRFIDFDAVIAHESTTLGPTRAPGDGDLVEIMFTSGTTSRPKGVMLTHANLVFSGDYVNWELAMTSEDRYLTAMLVTHANFQMSALLPVITSGSTLILARRYSAHRYWAEARAHHATLVQGMAMVVRTMLLQPIDRDERRNEVRAVHYFLPIADTEKAAFEQRFGAPLLNNYGSTETLVGVITDFPGAPGKWPSIGRIGPGYEARIVDRESIGLPPGQVGEILVRGVPGRTLAAGYWHDPDATRASFDPDGWFHTGDFGWRDTQGWFFFVGRAWDLIKTAGENVSAREVEDVLMQHPDVAEAAVVGISDGVRDELVGAFVVARFGHHPRADQLRAFCGERLACFKVPIRIDVVDDLPRGPYGKVRKDLLIHNTKG